MSCEVANLSPFGDPNDWPKVESMNEGLDAIANFNAGYASNDGNPVDPPLFSNTPPANDYHHNTYNVPSEGLDQTLSAEPSPFGDYPTDFNHAPSSPYFQSVEHQTPPPQIYHPSPLRNNAFRRSVSEPPGGPDLQQPGPPPMMFHREHHYLGKPMPRQAVQLKSLPKAKQQRQHPYQRANARRINAPEPGPPFRPEHRRAYTQPSRSGPTSNPMMMQMPQQQYMPHAPTMQEPQQFVSSRICAPIPEAAQIDPMLSASAIPSHYNQSPNKQSPPKNFVSIPLTVDELRSMIFEAVQKAVRETAAEEKKDSVAGMSRRNLAASVEDAQEEAEDAKGEDA